MPIGGLPAGGTNPLGGLAGSGAGLGNGATPGIGGSLSGMGDLGLGTGSSGSDNGFASLGMGPSAQATTAQGSSFADALRTMVIERPSASKAAAGELSARFAAGDTTIDPHKLALASAKAGVEIQMATRTISSAVSAVRTLFQMQV